MVRVCLRSYLYIVTELFHNDITEVPRALRRFNNQKHRRILFSDEKIFTIETYHNYQNDWELLLKGSHKDPNRTRVTYK